MNENLHSNKFLSGIDEGPVIVAWKEAGRRIFGGDHLIFGRYFWEIWGIAENFGRIQRGGGGGGGGRGATQICLENEDMGGWMG